MKFDILNERTIKAFARLSDILDTLRKECPWDRVQTLESLRYLTIEEVYELSDALIKVNSAKDDENEQHANRELKKELGDLLMHLMFYAKIAEDEKRFDLGDVFEAISDKLVERHPFIYGEKGTGESWEQIKMHEGRKSVMEGVPSALPALVKAVRIQEKASGIGYENNCDDSLIQHIVSSVGNNEQAWGDLLFTLVTAAHKQGINADDALEKANRRFIEQVKEWEKKK